MKNLLILGIAILASVAAGAQTAADVPSVMTDNNGSPLNGQICFETTCFTVTSGQVQQGAILALGTYDVVIKAHNRVYLHVPNVNVDIIPFFRWSQYRIPLGTAASGMGVPRMKCEAGATYTDTLTNSAYTCVPIGDGTGWKKDEAGFAHSAT